MGKFIRSPISYMGNKYRLLHKLLPLFPDKCNTFIEAFGGSGVISLNYKIPKNIIYNELDSNIIDLIRMIVELDPKELNSYLENQIIKFNLLDKSLAEQGFYELRNYYNENKDIRDLFLLMRCSINNMIRFNKEHNFNVPYGDRCYKDNNFTQIKNMHNIFKDVEISNKNFFDFDLSDLTKDDFIYLDPPYSNTIAIYNVNDEVPNWDIENDLKLFSILEDLDKRGIKWGMSNIFENRGIRNEHLIEWCEKNNWKVEHFNINYNPFNKEESNSDEVFIYNYSIPKQIKLF